MENIWRVSEYLAGRKLRNTEAADENKLETMTEKIFLGINTILWEIMGLAVSLILCKFYLNGISNNLHIVFMITGYFSVIMFLVGYIFLCRKVR